MKNVYLDSAATTQIRQEVIDKIMLVMQDQYGNASSTHSFGRSAKSIIEQARKNIAKQINAETSEIIFTSCGTEADNYVLRCAVRDLGVERIITSKIEHHAVGHTVEQLEEEYDIVVDYVNLDKYGEVDYEHLEKLLKSSTKTIVSLMHVNNEVGNLLDIKRVGELCKDNNALFHSDAVQSIGHFNVDVKAINVDFLAASAHKFHGPKGIGFAYVKKELALKPMIFGGGQERGCRAGTEPVHNIAGLEESLSLAYEDLEKDKAYILELKQHFIQRLKEAIPDVAFNGHSGNIAKSTYTLVNVLLPISSEKAALLLFQLDLKGIACSKGSACQSGASGGSHVLSEILTEEQMKQPSLRFSFSRYNTKEELNYVVDVLKEQLAVSV